MIEHPTQQQQRAISLLGPNLIVSAAAGSGKTAVMIERAVSMLTAGASVDELLMLTFTNAAASQMRQRIARDLTARLSTAPASIAPHLRDQANRIDGADISTINAYCVRLVRQYFHLVDVDPLFTLASEGEQAVLSTQALRTLMDRCFKKSDADFLFALEALAGNVEEFLCETILRVYRFAQTSADPDGWLDRAVSAYQGGARTQAIVEGDLTRLLPRFSRMARLCQTAAAYTQAHREPGRPLKMAQTLRENARTYRMLSVLPYPPDVPSLFKRAKPPANSIRHARMDEETFAPLRAMLQQIKDFYDEIRDQPVFKRPLDRILRDLSVMAKPMRVLQSLVEQFSQEYRALKQERNLLDFSDVEHLALQILRDPSVSAALRKRYACVFVDEYQDTNDLQEALITKLAQPGALFCVGDVKQSIYAFRHAEPALFLRRYMRSMPDGPAARQARDVRLDLNMNFRSTRNILQFVNTIFYRTMRADHGGLDYDERQALSPGTEDRGAPVNLCVLVRDEDRSLPEAAASFSCAQRHAIQCAARIRALLNERFFDGKTERNYRYDDIAILLRKMRTVGPAFVSMLGELGIPVSCAAQGDVLSAQETGAMLSLLNVIDNARDDVSMLAALRSPAALLSAHDLANIRAHDRTLPFALCARRFCEEGAGVSAQRVRVFFEKLDRYRAMARRVRVDTLLAHIYQDTHALAYYALLPDGEAKVENLMALLIRAQTFARLDDGSLYGFLQLVKLHSELGVSEVAPAPGGSDAVKVMTVHGAKGLEFPAVILPFLESPLQSGNGARLPLSREDGIGMRCYDPKTQTHRKSVIAHIVERGKQKQERDEEQRLLYVALTRAQHNLTLIGEGSPAQLERALDAAPPDAASPLAWVLPSVCRHETTAPLLDALSLPAKTAPAPFDLSFSLSYASDMQTIYDAILSDRVTRLHPPSSMDADAVARRLHYRYPFERDSLVAQKMSVSALHAGTAMPFEPLELPVLDERKTLDAADIGTAVHKAMLKLSFDGVDSVARINAQLSHMVQSGLLEAHQKDAIDARILFDFFQTQLGCRLLGAQQVLKEQPFVVRIPASVYDATLASGETTSLQGIIDCAFYQDGGWVLLDYKTNRLPKGGLAALREQYQVQMDAYRYALEILTGEPVMESALCLLMLREQLPMPPGDTYRALCSSHTGQLT